jgi:TolA-binding protein
MTMRSIFAGLLLAAMMVAAPGVLAPAEAQNTVSTNDIQRLQDSLLDLNSDLARLRSRDRDEARDYQDEVDEVRDEVVYLRVKLRKGQTVSRSEYAEVRDRIEELRSRVNGESSAESTSTTGSRSSTSTASTTRSTERSERTSSRNSSIIPVGQEVDVRLQDTLNSGTNQVEDRFIATTVVDLEGDGRTLIPAGSEMRGVVSAVQSAGRLNRKASLGVTFDQITIDGRTYPIRGTVTEALEGEGYRGDAAKIGTGAGVGAIIGGILGGLKGALAGILIGGGGVVAATEGKDVELPAGTILRVSLDSPPNVR